MSNNQNIRITATNRTNKAFNAINNNVKQVSSNLLSAKGAFAGFIGVAGIAKLTQFTKEAVEFADAIGKTADKLGVSTDALQEYRFAAARSGVAQTALDMGLQRFSRRLAEADKGTGELRKTLENLNISTRTSSGELRTSEDVLREYAEAIKNAEGDQEKLRLAFKAFDSEGAAMVNMLRDGATGLDDLTQAARDAGVVMDEELIDKAEIINDKWDTLTETIGVKFKSALVGLAGKIVGTRSESEMLADEIEVLTQRLTRVAEANTDNFLQRAFGTSTQDRIKGIVGEIETLSAKLNILNKPNAADGENPMMQVMGLTDLQIQQTLERDAILWSLKLDQDLAKEQESNAILEEVRLQRLANIRDHNNQEINFAIDKARQISLIEERERNDQIRRGEAAFATMLGNVAAHNKTFFKIQKVYRLSKLAMEAPAAIADSYAWGASWGGPPAGGVMAAIAGAAMLSYGVQLAGASYGGGAGSASAASTGGAGGSPVTSPVTPGQVTPFPESNTTGSTTVIINGDIIGTDEYVRDRFMPMIETAINKFDYTIIDTNSTQGRLLSNE